ncbi:MAG: LamG-like jellyroll fold domain-containing protein [Planctomycetota bacterium]
MRSLALAIPLLLAATGLSCAASEVHVAATGSDDAPGTPRRPVRTLGRAQVLARERIAEGLRAPLTVVIHEGTFRLAEPLVFTAEDSGTRECPVTWRAADGEKVTVSGGRRIEGWRSAGKGLWRADLGDAHWDLDEAFRELFVNGRRAVRARHPSASAERYALPVLDHQLSDDLKTQTIRVAPAHLARWRDLEDVEIVVYKNWASYHKRIAAVDPASGLVTVRPPHVKYRSSNRPRKGTYCFFENAREFLDEPGEWYLDRRTRALFYMPREGEDPRTVRAVAPASPALVLLKGEAGRPVCHLRFEGLSFMHNSYPLPPQGHHGRQAAFWYGGDGANGLPAMVQWEHAEDCRIARCEIAHGGSGGIELRAACRRNVIEGNRVHDIAGNGIGVGHRNSPETVPSANRIANNHVHHCGAVFLGACGIWVGLAEKTVVEHNLLNALPYTGVSVGWSWNTKPTVARGNVVAWNHIHDVLREVSDGGGIYSLGWQPGTVLRANHIHDVHRGPYAHAAPNNGFFLDEGSKGYLIERNLVYRTSGRTVRHNRNSAEWHTWRGNVFGRGPARRSRAGAVGRALAGGVVKEPHRPALDPERLTLMAWISPGGAPTAKDNRQWIANKNADEWKDGYFGLVLASQRPGAYLNIGGTKANRQQLFAPRVPFRPGEWRHIAMTYDGRAMALYVDGRREGEAVVGRRRRPGTGEFVIGHRADGYGPDFAGGIDDVRVYRAALSAAEIASIAREPKVDPRPADLAKRWDFEELGEAAADDLVDVRRDAGLEPEWRHIAE